MIEKYSTATKNEYVEAFMEQFRKADFSRHLVSLRPVTQFVILSCIFRREVARLNHEILDDAMKQDTIVGSLPHQFQEIVAVHGCFICQGDAYVAHRRLKQHFPSHCVRRILRMTTYYTRHERNQ